MERLPVFKTMDITTYRVLPETNDIICELRNVSDFIYHFFYYSQKTKRILSHYIAKVTDIEVYINERGSLYGVTYANFGNINNDNNILKDINNILLVAKILIGKVLYGIRFPYYI